MKDSQFVVWLKQLLIDRYIVTHLNDRTVNGRYDLWLLASSMGVPQKSLKNVRIILFVPRTSLLSVMAGISS